MVSHVFTLAVLGVCCVALTLSSPSRRMISKPPAACPSVPDAQGTATDCGDVCTDDSCDSVSDCCLTECGTKACRGVRQGCVDDAGVSYNFHDNMPYTGTDPGTCGVCWCQNNATDCVHWPCDGATP